MFSKLFNELFEFLTYPVKNLAQLNHENEDLKQRLETSMKAYELLSEQNRQLMQEHFEACRKVRLMQTHCVQLEECIGSTIKNEKAVH